MTTGFESLSVYIGSVLVPLYCTMEEKASCSMRLIIDSRPMLLVHSPVTVNATVSFSDQCKRQRCVVVLLLWRWRWMFAIMVQLATYEQSYEKWHRMSRNASLPCSSMAAGTKTSLY